MDARETWETLSYVVTVVGLPFAIAVFIFEQRRERQSEEEEIFQRLSDEYREFLKLVLDNSDLTLTRESGGTESGKRIWLGVQSNKFRMHGWGTTDPASTTSVTNGDYYHCVYAYNQSNKKHYIWVNGTLEHTSTNSQAGMTGWTNTSGLFWWVGRDPQAAGWTASASSYFNGDIAIFKTYSKILTNSEVKRNYIAYRRRFDLS